MTRESSSAAHSDHQSTWPTCLTFLTAYPHPAFALTTRAEEKHGEETFEPTYANPAYSQIFAQDLADFLRNSPQKDVFKRWIFGGEPTLMTEFLGVDDRAVPVDVTKTQVEADMWVCTTVPRTSPLEQHGSTSEEQDGLDSEVCQPPSVPSEAATEPDVSPSPTSPSTPPPLPENTSAGQSPITIAELMETYDYSNSWLGPRELWSSSLKSAVNMILGAPIPSCVCWGPDLVVIYNDGYAKICGSKHPRIWGMPAALAWPDVWPSTKASADIALSGKYVWYYDTQLFLERLSDSNLLQECYFTWSYSPVYQEDGTVGGFSAMAQETTEQIIAQRQMKCLKDVITATITTASAQDYYESVLRVFSKESFTADFPFAALYSCSVDETIKKRPKGVANVSLCLAGTIGIPKDHPSTPETVSIRLEFSDTTPGVVDAVLPTDLEYPWPFIQAIQSREPVHVPPLHESFTQGYEKRGWGDQPREAIVIPMGFVNPAVAVPTAVLVLGINTRRQFNETYRSDINVLAMTLSATLHAASSRAAEVKRTKQMVEMDAAKTVFFSNASHELRTPLTLVESPLEDCLKDVPDGRLKDNILLALRNTHRLRRLVDSLMDFSKLAANKLEGHFRPVKLGLFTADLASLFRSSVERGGLVYNVECDSSPTQPQCYVDTEFWEKIVFNIIGNALKFTLEGSITVTVTHTEQHAIFAVKDTGAGIPPSDIDRIFERFYRTKTTGRSREGTGIGLALTKELVALHGGELWADSEDDPCGPHGTTFTAKIPLGKDHLRRANIRKEGRSGSPKKGVYARGVIEEASLWTHSPPSSEEDESGAPTINVDRGRLDPATMFFRKDDIVLLADDNADMRGYIKSLLSRYCRVVEASNGRRALQLASEETPSIVLSDVMMPDMDGFTLLRELRDRPHTASIPIILLTARSSDDSRVEGLLSGSDDYLTKPFKSAELIARVHLQMQLGKKRAIMEAKFKERTLELQQLSEMSPVAIFRTNKEGKIEYVNPRWYNITGRSKDSPVDRWFESVHSNYKDAVEVWWNDAHKNEGTNTSPTILDFRWKNGDWCQGQCVSLEGRGTLGAFTDISEQRRLEESQLTHALEKEATAHRKAAEAEERRKEAEERRRGQELLIDVTSHELRQPVSAILNCSSLVRHNLSLLYEEISARDTFTATSRMLQTIQEDLDALDAIYQCGLVQERIANDVLSLSRMQLDVLSIHPVDFDLAKEIGKITALFRNETRMKRIQLDIQFGRSLGQYGIKYVAADRSRFSQILTNLLSNAIKFTDTSTGKRDVVVNVNVGLESPPADSCEPPQPTNSLRIRIAPKETIFIYVSVTDSGPGLDPSDLHRLFQRFQQGSHSHDVFGGSGLGLFVSRQLCSLMGGRITVSSTPGEGATFRFFIQATTATAPLAAPILSRTPSAAVSPSSPELIKPMHILITEDNLINQTVLSRQLERAGCTIAVANNGRQAIDLLCASTESFDAIMMDVEMPVLDGLSAVREIRELEEAGKLLQRHRIFALTANAREGQVENIRQAGMDEVIIKPYRIEDILTKLWASTP